MIQLIQLIQLLLFAALIVLLLPTAVLLLQTLLALRPLTRLPAPNRQRPSVGILIPAHNEESGITATIASLLPQLKQGDQILVIADNCSDNTAGVARAAGATVRERFDQHLRGKGYALDFGVRCMHEQPPAILIIVDADCIV